MTLQLGRPENRRKTYRGDRRGLVAEGRLLGHDAHGVFWRPVREYGLDADGVTVADDQAAVSTLVVFAPVHPSELGVQ